MSIINGIKSLFGFSGRKLKSVAVENNYPPNYIPYDEQKARSQPAGVMMPAFLPYYDDQTGETPEMRFQYRKMLADPNIKAPLLAKIFGVGALDMQIHPYRKGKDPRAQEQAEFMRWTLTERLEGGIPGMAWDVFIGGLVDGHSVLEKVFEPPSNEGEWGGKIQLTHLKPKDVNNDLVLVLDEYRSVKSILGLRYNGGLTFDASDFLIYSHLPVYGQVTGMSDLRAAYGRYWVLDTVVKLRAWGAEKRAFPVVAGEYPDVTKKAALEQMLAKVKSQNWLSVPAGAKLQVLELDGAAYDYFATFIKDLREEIVMSISLAVLNSMQGGEGVQRGSSDVHQDTSDLGKWFLSVSLANLLNSRGQGLIKDVIDRNYANVYGYPKATFGGVDGEKHKARTELAKSLNEMGLNLSKNQLYEETAFNIPEDPTDILPGKAAAAAPGAGAGGPGGGPPGLMEEENGRAREDTERLAGAGGPATAPFRGFAESSWGYRFGSLD